MLDFTDYVDSLQDVFSDLKCCTKCHIYKHPSWFHKNSNAKDGLSHVCKTCVKQYNAENSDRLSQCSKIWRAKNIDKFRAYQRGYRSRLSSQRIKALNDIRILRMSSVPNTLTNEQWQRALNYFNGCCAVCGRQLNDMFKSHSASADHWIPLSKGGGTVALNIVPLCHGVGGCNNSKHDKMPEEWLLTRYSKKETQTILKRIQDYFDWVISRNNAA